MNDSLDETFDLFESNKINEIKAYVSIPLQVKTSKKESSWEKIMLNMEAKRDRSMKYMSLKSGITIEDTNEFLTKYHLIRSDKNQSNENFLSTYKNKPNYNEQITSIVIDFLQQNELGYKNSSLNRDNQDAYDSAVKQFVSIIIFLYIFIC